MMHMMQHEMINNRQTLPAALRCSGMGNANRKEKF